MGHGQTDKHDWSAVGGDNRHQDAGTQDHQQTGTMDVQPQVAGVVATQQQQVHRFDQQEGERDQEGHERHEEQHLVARHTGEAAQAPDHVGTNILLHAEELQHAGNILIHILHYAATTDRWNHNFLVQNN